MRSVDVPANEPVYVPAILEAMFGDAPGVIAAVLDRFCTSMNQQMVLLQAAQAIGDTAAQQQIAHRIKGAARMSGALAMADCAQRLEHAARSAGVVADAQNDCGALAAALVQQWGLLPDDATFCRARHGG